MRELRPHGLTSAPTRCAPGAATRAAVGVRGRLGPAPPSASEDLPATSDPPEGDAGGISQGGRNPTQTLAPHLVAADPRQFTGPLCVSAQLVFCECGSLLGPTPGKTAVSVN